MPAKEKKGSTLHFQGRPDELETLVPHVVESATIHLRLAGAGEEREIGEAARIDTQIERVAAGATFLRFALPASTPPGEYAATVHFDGKEHAAVVNVLPAPDLQAWPTQITLAVNPGETITMPLTVIGGGNVPVRIPHVHGIGVFEDDGLEDALSAVYRDSTVKGLDRLGKLADELAKRHALIRAVIKEGETTVEPGQLYSFTAELRFSKVMRHGRGYSGTWPLAANIRLAVHVDVSGVPDPKEALND